MYGGVRIIAIVSVWGLCHEEHLLLHRICDKSIVAEGPILGLITGMGVPAQSQ